MKTTSNRQILGPWNFYFAPNFCFTPRPLTLCFTLCHGKHFQKHPKRCLKTPLKSYLSRILKRSLRSPSHRQLLLQPNLHSYLCSRSSSSPTTRVLQTGYSLTRLFLSHLGLPRHNSHGSINGRILSKPQIVTRLRLDVCIFFTGSLSSSTLE